MIEAVECVMGVFEEAKREICQLVQACQIMEAGVA
jgi:hypothetical protein